MRGLRTTFIYIVLFIQRFSDRPTNLIIEAPCRSLKICWLYKINEKAVERNVEMTLIGHFKIQESISKTILDSVKLKSLQTFHYHKVSILLKVSVNCHFSSQTLIRRKLGNQCYNDVDLTIFKNLLLKPYWTLWSYYAMKIFNTSPMFWRKKMKLERSECSPPCHETGSNLFILCLIKILTIFDIEVS